MTQYTREESKKEPRMRTLLKIIIVFLFLSVFIGKPVPSYAWHGHGHDHEKERAVVGFPDNENSDPPRSHQTQGSIQMDTPGSDDLRGGESHRTKTPRPTPLMPRGVQFVPCISSMRTIRSL